MRCGTEGEARFTSEFATKLLECPKVWLAGTEGTSLSDSIIEVHGNEVGDADVGRGPAGTLDTTV